MGDQPRMRLPGHGVQIARDQSQLGLKFGATFAAATAKGSGRHTLAGGETPVFLDRSLIQAAGLAGETTEEASAVKVVFTFNGAAVVCSKTAGHTALDTDAKGGRSIVDGGSWERFVIGPQAASDENPIAFLNGNGAVIDYEIFVL